MKASLSKDQFERGWKMVTIFIGTLDACSACKDSVTLFKKKKQLSTQSKQRFIKFIRH
jgi:hypothetical protein